MAFLSKTDIIAADDRRYEDVDVPEWGGEVRILGMSGTDRNAYQESMVVLGAGGKPQKVNLQDQLARLLSRCLVGEDFQRLFTDREVKELGKKNGAVLERLGKIAQRLSGLGKEELEAAAGNSETGQSDSSISA